MKRLIFKYLHIFIFTCIIGVALTGCRDDEPSSKSIFEDVDTSANTEFDNWIKTHFTDSFNIRIIYRYVDKETSSSYNVIPTAEDKAIGMAIILRHVWLGAYREIMQDVDTCFMEKYSPKLFRFVGSAMYETGTGKMTLGDAGGGSIVTLTNVNAIDLDNPYVDITTALASKSENPLDMNYWFFKTMHHEFCHILTQNKDYSTDFRTISVGKYAPSDWYNKGDNETLPEGFVSAYASSESNEDFAETYAYYVTHTQEALDALLAQAGEEGASIINQKIEFIRTYCNDTWKMDLDHVREVVLRRAQEVTSLDLKHLD